SQFCFSSRRRHTRFSRDWSSDVCSSDLDYLSFTGKPYNVLRGFKAIGLFVDEQDVINSPTQFGKVRPGDIKYKDVTGDGVITDEDRKSVVEGRDGERAGRSRWRRHR